eukprot:1793563-Prymnesium_polylepis.1
MATRHPAGRYGAECANNAEQGPREWEAHAVRRVNEGQRQQPDRRKLQRDAAETTVAVAPLLGIELLHRDVQDCAGHQLPKARRQHVVRPRRLGRREIRAHGEREQAQCGQDGDRLDGGGTEAGVAADDSLPEEKDHQQGEAQVKLLLDPKAPAMRERVVLRARIKQSITHPRVTGAPVWQGNSRVCRG